MRKLASIQKVVAITPIEKADRIECVQILGWEVVARKGEFKVNDFVVYFEIDSALPISDKRFTFLAERRINMPDGTEKIERKTKMLNGIESAILKSVKLRKQISQGLIMAISDFPEIKNLVEDMEVTELLKVQKYELADVDEVEPTPKETPIVLKFLYALDKIPQPMVVRKRLNILRSSFKPKKVDGIFPSFIPCTDEDRIQNCYGKLVNRPDIKNLIWEATIKMDGSSGTYFLMKAEFGVCSRNVRKNPKERVITIKKISWLPAFLQRTERKVIPNTDKFCHMAVKYEIEKKLRKIGRNLAIQGEVVGEGIQDNREKIVGHEFYVFNLFDIDLQRYLTPVERWEMMDKLNEGEAIKLNHVPILDKGIKVFDKFSTLEEILKFSEGKNAAGNEREGIVYKLVSDNGQKLSFKVVSNKYLLEKN